jgi:hypothetical protein
MEFSFFFIIEVTLTFAKDAIGKIFQTNFILSLTTYCKTILDGQDDGGLMFKAGTGSSPSKLLLVIKHDERPLPPQIYAQKLGFFFIMSELHKAYLSLWKQLYAV